MGTPQFDRVDMEDVASCELCASTGVVLNTTRGIGLTVQECGHCGLAYVSPRPAPSAMRRHYENEYAPQDFDRQLADSRAFGIQRTDLRRIEAAMTLQGAHVLDVGCGPGLLLNALAGKGTARIVGIEPGRAAAAFAERNVPGVEIIRSPVDEAEDSLSDSSFDLITALDLLEHMYEPRVFIQWAAGRLAAGGLLYIKTPNWGAFAKYGASWEGLWRDFEHLYYFSQRRLGSLLEEEGLAVVEWAFEPMRGGMGGAQHTTAPAGGARKLAALRSLASRVPLMNSATYQLLEHVRRVRNRRDLREGTAPVLVALAMRL